MKVYSNANLEVDFYFYYFLKFCTLRKSIKKKKESRIRVTKIKKG